VRKFENDGGAGGFYEGMKQAYEPGFNWIWIMDDDCIPTETALEELNKHSKLENLGFLSSRVVGINGISMNVPSIDKRKGPNQYPVWDALLDKALVKIQEATFVSVYMQK